MCYIEEKKYRARGGEGGGALLFYFLSFLFSLFLISFGFTASLTLLSRGPFSEPLVRSLSFSPLLPFKVIRGPVLTYYLCREPDHVLNPT